MPVLILKNDSISLSYMIDVNLIWETNLTCVNQIVSLRLFTNFSNVRFMRKTNNAKYDVKIPFKRSWHVKLTCDFKFSF